MNRRFRTTMYYVSVLTSYYIVWYYVHPRVRIVCAVGRTRMSRALGENKPQKKMGELRQATCKDECTAGAKKQ